LDLTSCRSQHKQTENRDMQAAWYERQGPADQVLLVGERPDPEPGPGEVRVRVRYSGINPGDTKKRRGWLGSTMPYPRVIPHSDAAGVIDRVGDGVSAARVGQRVWVYGAQSYRPFGTAAEFTVVPTDLAIDLPPAVTDEVGASLGIPGITAHRAVFADGAVDGTTVLVHGVLGGVGSLAAQLAGWGGATVIGTVRRRSDLADVLPAVHHAVSLDDPDAVAAIRRIAPDGVDRVVEVAFSTNVDLDAAVLKNLGTIAAYATSSDRPDFPFWPMLFDNVTIRLLGSDDFPTEAKRQAALDLTTAAAQGAIQVRTGPPLPVDAIAQAHELVDAGTRGRVLLSLPE
jgi:NADPH2:quinone reductase